MISEETRRKMSKSHIGQIAWNKGLKGKSPWNKGLTKETDTRVMNNSKEVSKALLGKYRKYKEGSKNHYLEIRNKCLLYMDKDAKEVKDVRCYICSKKGKTFFFHHIDPKAKKFGVLGDCHLRTWKALKEEMNKCILVCISCHSSLHHKAYNFLVELGKEMGYIYNLKKEFLEKY